MTNNIDTEDAAICAFECAAALHHAFIKHNWDNDAEDKYFSNSLLWIEMDKQTLQHARHQAFLRFLAQDDELGYQMKKKGLQAEVNLLLALMSRETTQSKEDFNSKKKTVDLIRTKAHPANIVAAAKMNAENLMANAELLLSDHFTTEETPTDGRVMKR